METETFLFLIESSSIEFAILFLIRQKKELAFWCVPRLLILFFLHHFTIRIDLKIPMKNIIDLYTLVIFSDTSAQIQKYP